MSLVAGGATATCEPCTAEAALSGTTALIQHPHGATVQLVAGDWCVQAMRRLSAATGGQAIFVLSETAGPPPSALPATPRGPRPAGPPVPILEFAQQVQDAAGGNYVVRVFGRERSDGTWEGWLEFVAVGAAQVLRTGRETTHSSREDLAYWATGLGTAYPEGAFARAQRDPPTSLGDR